MPIWGRHPTAEMGLTDPPACVNGDDLAGHHACLGAEQVQRCPHDVFDVDDTPSERLLRLKVGQDRRIRLGALAHRSGD